MGSSTFRIILGALLVAVAAYTGGASLPAAIALFAASVAIGFASEALTPKPKVPDFTLGNFASEAEGRTRQVTQPISPWHIPYGSVRKSGTVTFLESTDNNKFLHFVITIAGTAIDSLLAYQLDEDLIYSSQLDANGLVTTGKYANKVQLQIDLGTTGAAFPELAAAAGGWSSSSKQAGRTKIYIRLEFDSDLFVGSIPNVSVWILGAVILDTRDSVSRFSTNPALILRDYLASSAYGLGAASIDSTFLNAAANICDEFVTVTDIANIVTAVNTDAGSPTETGSLDLTDNLKMTLGDRVQLTTTGTLPAGLATATNYFVIPDHPRANDVLSARIGLASSYANALSSTRIGLGDEGSGTHTVTKKAEPRYTANGVVDVSRRPIDVIEDILSAMGGRAISIGGSWRILAAAYQTPTITLNEDHVISPIDVSTRISRRERFNAVKGVYVSPFNSNQPTDYPIIENSTYQTNDGGTQVFAEHDLPFTNRPHTAQRLAKIRLERLRQEITVKMRCNLHALQIQAGDTVMLTNERMGWVAKPFECVAFQLVSEDVEGVPMLQCDLTLRETASGVFDWNNGEETTFDLAPNTTLPDAFTVGAPISVAVTTDSFLTDSGTKISRICVTWTKHTNFFVRNNGRIEVQFKRTDLGSPSFVWEPSWFVDGAEVRSSTPSVEDGQQYDIRVRAWNHLGVKSEYSTIANYTVGSSGAGAELQLDYGLVDVVASELFDRGSVAVAVDKQVDYGLVA